MQNRKARTFSQTFLIGGGMKRISLVLVVILFSGCMTVQLDSIGIEKSIGMTANINKKFTVVHHFREDVKGWFTLFDLITISNPDVSGLLQKEVVDGDAITNLKIQGQTTFVDALVSIGAGAAGVLIGGAAGANAAYLISARTYTVEGDVVKYTEEK
jgi:hypothetical protein